MSDHRFLVLEVVRMSQHPSLVADGSAGRRGVVTGIRRYGDGSFRYEMSSTEETNADNVAGIYDEDMLIPTGERASPETFALPAGFRVRDVATGERLPPTPLGAGTESAQVSGAGELLGTSSYVLIDDLDHHL